MNLPLLLITRLLAITALCLAGAVAWTVFDAHRSLARETAASSERVGRHLAALYWQESLWRGMARSGLGSADPQWQSFATLNLISPGVCVGFALRGEPPRTLCSQTAALGRPAPAWFERAYGAVFTPDAPVRRVLFERHPEVGEVVHTADRGAAIRQAWQQISLLAGVAGAMALGTAVLAALMIGHALRPARTIIQGLRRLELGQLGVRLPRFATADFTQIAQATNALAGQLQRTQAERAALTTQLLQVQETERRALARDLHDEFGQCLTATAALAASIEAGAPAGREDIADEARAIGRAQARMMTTLRGALARLRTQDIDELGLEASLRQLVGEHNLQTPSRDVFRLCVAGEIASLPVPIAIDVYRIAQECLTNAARHGAPHRVQLSVHLRGHLNAQRPADARSVAVTVEDDGGGGADLADLADRAARAGHDGFGGHGILGMRERLAARGGSLAIQQAKGGLRVAAVIPLQPAGA